MSRTSKPCVDPQKIDDHILGLPLAGAIPRAASVAAVIPPMAWQAISEALEPQTVQVVDAILSRFPAPHPAPVSAPASS